MRITPIEDIDILAMIGSADRAQRAPGAHVKAIIDDMMATIGKKRKAAGWDESGALDVAAQIGYVWEEIFTIATHRLATRGDFFLRAQPLTLDGIIGTPDLIRASDGMLVELKARWRSLRSWDALEENYLDVIWQIQAYCKMSGRTEAELYMAFVNGDYAGSGPQIRGCKFTFTPRELDDVWRSIKRHARDRGII